MVCGENTPIPKQLVLCSRDIVPDVSFLSFNVSETFICNWKQRNHWVKSSCQGPRGAHVQLPWFSGTGALPSSGRLWEGRVSLIWHRKGTNFLFEKTPTLPNTWMKVSMGGFGFPIKETPTHIGHLEGWTQAFFFFFNKGTRLRRRFLFFYGIFLMVWDSKCIVQMSNLMLWKNDLLCT